MISGNGKLLLSSAERYAHARFSRRLAQVQAGRSKAPNKTFVKVPRKKSWPRNAVMVTLSEALPMDPYTNAAYPQTTLDLAPVANGHRIAMYKAIKNANNTVQFLKDRDSDLLKIDWNTSSEMKSEVIEATPDLSTSGKHTDDRSSTAILEDLMIRKDFMELETTCNELLENGIDIPDEVKEKVLAFASYHGPRQDPKFLPSILSIIPPRSKYMYGVVLRSLAISKEYHALQSWYLKMREAGFIQDIETTDIILSYANYDSTTFISNLIKNSVEVRTRPTARTILQTQRLLHSSKASQQRDNIGVLAKCLGEIEQCAAEPKLSTLVELLGFSCEVMWNSSAGCAVLELMDKVSPAPIRNSMGFVGAMRMACRKGDFHFAERILMSTKRLNITLPQTFYFNYIELVGKHASAETFLDACVKMIGSVVYCHPTLYMKLVEICVDRGWPQALPCLFSLVDSTMTKPETQLPFMKAAVQLADVADPSTSLQLKNIAYMLLDMTLYTRGGLPVDFINFLFVMFSKYGEKQDLERLLTRTSKYSRHLSEAVVEEYKKLLSQDIDVATMFDGFKDNQTQKYPKERKKGARRQRTV